MDAERQALLDKALKLMALAEDQKGTPEGETAAKMLMKHLAKYEIEYNDLHGTSEAFTTDIHKLDVRVHNTGHSTLWNVIAQYNGVALLTTMVNYSDTSSLKVAAYKLVGKKSDIEAALYMGAIVDNQMKAAYTAYQKKCKVDGLKPERVKWENGFAIGANNKIQSLMRQKAEAYQEYGLVPVDPAKQAMDWYKENNNVRTKNTAMKYNAEGLRAGNNIHLNQGVGNGASNKVLR